MPARELLQGIDSECPCHDIIDCDIPDSFPKSLILLQKSWQCPGLAMRLKPLAISNQQVGQRLDVQRLLVHMACCCQLSAADGDQARMILSDICVIWA